MTDYTPDTPDDIQVYPPPEASHKCAMLDSYFDYRPATNEAVKKIDVLRAKTKHLAKEYLEHVPDTAERKLAIRKLQEALFWANHSITRNG